MAWAVVSSLLVYPHSLSYFNELAGGPAHGSEHLLDSNIDWGQDLLYLRDWLKEHPEARPLQLAYFGYFDPRVAGIEFELPPEGRDEPRRGHGPVGAGDRPPPRLVRGERHHAARLRVFHPGRPRRLPRSFALNSFSYFQRFRPVAHAGWSIYIYHITPEECAADTKRDEIARLDGVGCRFGSGGPIEVHSRPPSDPGKGVPLESGAGAGAGPPSTAGLQAEAR